MVDVIEKRVETRLYRLRLFPRHEPDPRTSRSVVKVEGIFRAAGDSRWDQIPARDLLVEGFGS